GLGFGVELGGRLGARKKAERPDGKTQRPRTVQGNPFDRGEHSFLPLFIHAFSRKKNARQSQGTVRVGIDGRGIGNRSRTLRLTRFWCASAHAGWAKITPKIAAAPPATGLPGARLRCAARARWRRRSPPQARTTSPRPVPARSARPRSWSGTASAARPCPSRSRN